MQYTFIASLYELRKLFNDLLNIQIDKKLSKDYSVYHKDNTDLIIFNNKTNEELTWSNNSMFNYYQLNFIINVDYYNELVLHYSDTEAANLL